MVTADNVQRSLGSIEARLDGQDKHNKRINDKLDEALKILNNAPNTCRVYRDECQNIMSAKISLNTDFRKNVKWYVGALVSIMAVVGSYYKWFA